MSHDNTEPHELALLREALAARTHTKAEDWYLTFKARYGMREVFSALREAYGDATVATTLFTGCTAVDSIISAGLTPTYEPVSDDTLGMDARSLELSPSARAVLLQHSYGVVDASASVAIAQKAHDSGALLVEDSAHCLARMATDAAGSPLADVSIHSFGIEKTFSNIYFGGAIWVNPAMADRRAHELVVRNLKRVAPLPARIDRACRHYRNHARLLVHLPGRLSGALHGVLLRTGRFEPPVADCERRGELAYDSYAPSAWICARILDMLPTLDEDERRRKACGVRYQQQVERLTAQGVRVPSAALREASEQPLIRFPVLLPNADDSLRAQSSLAASGLYAVPWYHVPFFPGAADLRPYGLEEADVAAYRKRFGGVLGLPTDISPERVDEAVDAVVAALQ